MPIYEYACKECEYELEEVQKFSDPILVNCPQCENDTLYRKMSVSAFHLKGGGWYKDGYGLNSSQKKGNTDSKKPASQKESSDKTPTNSTSKADSNTSTTPPPVSSKLSSKTSSANNAAA